MQWKTANCCAGLVACNKLSGSSFVVGAISQGYYYRDPNWCHAPCFRSRRNLLRSISPSGSLRKVLVRLETGPDHRVPRHCGPMAPNEVLEPLLNDD